MGSCVSGTKQEKNYKKQIKISGRSLTIFKFGFFLSFMGNILLVFISQCNDFKSLAMSKLIRYNFYMDKNSRSINPDIVSVFLVWLIFDQSNFNVEVL